MRACAAGQGELREVMGQTVGPGVLGEGLALALSEVGTMEGS